MDTDKFDYYRINKFKEIFKNLKKIKLLLNDINFQKGGDITKQDIDNKYKKLLEKLDDFTDKVVENEQRYAQALLEIDNILK